MWLWIIATLVAFFIKGLCGFANSLIFSSILGLGIDNVRISPVELVLGYPTNVILAVKNRQHLKTKIWLPMALCLLLGNIPGAILLKNVDATKIKLVFGIVVVLLGIELYLRENGHNIVKESKAFLGGVGLAAGLMCGIFGIGVLVAAYISRVTTTTDEFKANTGAVFIVENTVRIVLYSVLGVITAQSLKTAFALMPLMLLAMYGGMKFSKVLDEKVVKRIVILMLIVSGIYLIVKNI